jgi:predicted amidophosphoribosyltransferase
MLKSKLIAPFLSSLSALIFPSFCLHCEERLDQKSTLLCSACVQQLELLSPEMRCSSCFAPLDFIHQTRCSACYKNQTPPIPLASCFEAEGACKSILAAFKSGRAPFLAAPLASYLFLQMTLLNWPIPDCITFVPDAPLITKIKGPTSSFLLAEALGALLQVPCKAILSKEYSSIERSLFKKGPKLNKNEEILLIDTIQCTETHSAARSIFSANPKSLAVLTLC